MEAKLSSSDSLSFLKEAAKLCSRIEFDYDSRYDNETKDDDEDSIVESGDSFELESFE